MTKRAYHISPSSAECQQCKSYRPDVGCTEISCIHLKAAINEGIVTYRDLLMTIYPQPPTFGWKLQELAGTYPGYLWNSKEHRQRYIYSIEQLPSPITIKVRTARRYAAVVFIFSTSSEFFHRTYKCIQPVGIDFSRVYTQNMPKEHSFLLHVARCLYESRDEQLILNLGYSKAVYSKNLRTILHGILIAKYGVAVFYLKGDGGC